VIYGIIPARSGSKSVKDKNIRLLGGKPVLQYSIESALECLHIGKVIVTTDKVEYCDIAKSVSSKVETLLRPPFCCTDKAKDIDYLLHAIYTLKMDIDDIIVLLRPTTPLRKTHVLNSALEMFFKYLVDGAHHSLRSFHVLPEPPEKMYRMKMLCDLPSVYIEPYMGNDNENANIPKEQFKKCYAPNGYIDIVTVRNIIETKTTYGDKVLGYKTEKAIEIDSQEEFDYLQYLVTKK